MGHWMDELDDSCGGCVFAKLHFTDEDNEPLMKCRRYPPAVVIHDGDFHQVFPDANLRCGEYKKSAASNLDKYLHPSRGEKNDG